MKRMLGLFKAVAERESGFWIDVPVDTGRSVSREEWMSLMSQDPDHFQLATFTADEWTGCPAANGEAIELAVLVTWSDENLQ